MASFLDLKNWLTIENDKGQGQSYDCNVIVSELLTNIGEYHGDSISYALHWNPFDNL